MGTLRDNLDPLKEYETDKIEKVCQNCQLFSLDSFKSDQLLTQISVGGCNLSMGEKQMITIARCVLQNRKIILVDEATASIDGPTEIKIKQMFEQYFQSNTVITIAHKVTTIMDSNRIMVLDDGKIVEFDTPQKLLEDPNSEFKQILGMIQEAELL